jgi:glycosyltransferase involved in cell wall biosynthesis
MDWSNYLTYTGSVRRDIGLAPLLPEPFNAGRAPTKFFDFARMGAVGIYTDTEPYRNFVRHGVDGLLLPNEPMAWAAAIDELATDAVRRQGLAAAARERALAMAGTRGDQHSFSRT